jgi:hypothetical protein
MTGSKDQIPPLFTVVPILAITHSTFGLFDKKPNKPITDVQLCSKISKFDRNDHDDISGYCKLPLLEVIGGNVSEQFYGAFQKDFCASKALCLHKDVDDAEPASLEDSRCPGCGLAVHFECGFIDSSDSGPDGITCLLCYYKFGRTLKGPSDPDFRPRSEKDPSDAVKKKAARKKDRASRPKTGANDVNDEDQSSSAESTVGTNSEPDHSTQDPPLFPAANTRAARPSPYRSAKPKKLSSSRSPSAK